jgi:steroid delta-isomerase-like uncharacterized protein
MATDQNKKVIDQIFNECMNKKNLDMLDNLLDPGFVHSSPNSGKGPQGFRAILEPFFKAFPDFMVHVEEMIGEGETVASRGYLTGTHKGEFMGINPTGKQMKMPYIDFWKLRNGKCVANWVEFDMAGLMQQIGARQESVASS